VDFQAMGRVGLTGVRGRVGRRAARAVSNRTDLDEELVAAVIGGALLALWVYQTVKTLRAVLEAGRGERQPDLAAEDD
jgi:dihydrodipicolinate reductase